MGILDWFRGPETPAPLGSRTTPPPATDIASIVPALKGRSKTTVRLHPRPGEASIVSSKIGGTFVWPKDTKWPACEQHGCPFVSVLQLRKGDVPEVGFPGDKDLMQILWCPLDHDAVPKLEMFWWKESDIGLPAQVPAYARQQQDYYFPRPCVLHPERVVEFPDPFELDSELNDDIDQLEELENLIEELNETEPPENLHYPEDGPNEYYQAYLSAAPGTKVGGYPDWVQDPWQPQCKCGQPMEHLVSFDSTEFDGNTWNRWIPLEDRNVLQMDYEATKPVGEPTDWMFGDSGRLYVFVCRHCEGMPFEYSMQCC